MNKTVIGATLGACLAGLAGPAMAQAKDCDRECLTGVLDDYLAALEARDGSGLNLHASVKYTENGQRLNIGDGLWQTYSSGPHYRVDVVDVEAGQIAMLGILEENGNRNFFSTRIAVEDNPAMGRGVEITEIENLIARSNTRVGSAQMALEREEFQQMMHEELRSSRGEMVSAANSYFTGLDTDESAENVPFAETCRRIENGTVTANDPEGASEMIRMGCAAQFDTGFSIIVTDIRERRFPVVDEEKGLVYALGFFDHDGAVTSYNAVDGQESERMIPLRQPFSFMIAEVFQIEDGQINQIEAVLTTVPYKMESGW